MNFVESFMIYIIDQITYFAFVLVGILYSLVMNATTMFQMVFFLVKLTFLVVSHIQTLITLYILL
jgi:hypothetical protein